MSIKRKLARSSLWMIAANAFNTLSTTVVFIALARLLTPVEFGVVAFASVFIEFSRILVISGIADALIQRPTWDQAVASTAFWTNMALGTLVAALLSAGGLLFGDDYGQSNFPEVLAALSLLLLIEGAATVHTAKLRREFHHKIIARRSMAANIIAGTLGVTLAYLGWGVWAMVLSRVVSSGMSSLLLWRSSGFRPSFSYSYAHYKQFRTFALHQLGTQMLGTANAQAAALIIGAFIGPAAIAQYRVGSRALTMLVSLAITPLQSASMSAFARVNEQYGKIGPAYLRVTRTCAVLTSAAFFGLAGVAPDLVRVVFGPQWGPGGYVMLALALSVGPTTLTYFQGPALSASGRTGLTFWATLTGFIGNVIAALITVSFGPIAVAIGYTVRAHITTPLGLRFVEKGIGVRPMQAIRNITPPYLCGAAMAICVTLMRLYLVDHWSTPLRLVACVAAGGVLYVAFMLLFARRFVATGLADLLPVMPGPIAAFIRPKVKQSAE
jgi:O-antigen/teichoic acid export membrane protein